MGKRRPMQQVARWHIWLGWAVAVPVLLWTASGLFMAARPIEQVRGEYLRATPPLVDGASLVWPKVTGPVGKVALVAEAGKPVWVVSAGNASPRRYSATDGSLLGHVDEAEARRIAEAAFADDHAISALTRFDAAQAPLDLRRPRPSWQARFADGTHVYVDAESGEVLALRTVWWRAYDLMWGLHIMDLETREDTSNPWLWSLGGLALVSSLLGSLLLFRRRRTIKRDDAGQA